MISESFCYDIRKKTTPDQVTSISCIVLMGNLNCLKVLNIGVGGAIIFKLLLLFLFLTHKEQRTPRSLWILKEYFLLSSCRFFRFFLALFR